MAPKRNLAKLSLGALGVVYGDIGTSPLYAMKACFSDDYGVAASRANVLGVVSLFLWSLTLVVALKYLVFIVRADNRGEGGVLALIALLKASGKRLGWIALLGLFGASLLYGEAVITPVVSVLGATEGLAVVDPAVFAPAVVIGIAVVILLLLFAFQRRGTSGVGAVFGPAMLVWFVMIAVVGGRWIVKEPAILAAIDPRFALRFLSSHGLHGFAVIGAVALCVTGSEAIYTDMGHFGVAPLKAAWFCVAYPALMLDYFGQGALLLHASSDAHALTVARANPFYAMADGWARYPMIAVATVAAIIASQALISGAFSLTRQAVQLGYWPRVDIRHTSESAQGQIYIPAVNTALAVGCISLVLAFGETTRLAAAYGLAVTGTMSITSVLFYAVARKRWSGPIAAALTACFLVVDLSFFFSNARKVAQGGWIPLALALAIFTLMTTWHAGRALLERNITGAIVPLTTFMDTGSRSPHRMRGTARVPGSAIFLTQSENGASLALCNYLEHHLILHDTLVLLSIHTTDTPEVSEDERIERIALLAHNVHHVKAVYGFMQTPSVLEVIAACRRKGLDMDPNETTFFVGRETLVVSDTPGMAKWRKALFAYMSRNTREASAFFAIPASRVVELGTHIEL